MSKKSSAETPKWPLEFVKWVDAKVSNLAWEDLNDLMKEEPAICASVGWVVKDTDTCLTLVASVVVDDPEDDSTIGVWQIIPKSWVVERRQLK